VPKIIKIPPCNLELECAKISLFLGQSIHNRKKQTEKHG